MTAKILPLIRLPAHLDYFDYAVPKSLYADIRVGQIVRIPFRKSTINGIVIELQKDTHTETLKSIERILVHAPVFSIFQKELLSWFPDFYFVSRATVARMMLLPPLTRKKKEVVIQEVKREILSKKKIRLSPVSIEALAGIMRCISKTKKSVLFSCTNEHEKIALYTKCAQNNIKQKKQLLIICPTIPEAEYIAECLSPYLSSSPLCIHGNLRISDLRNKLEQIQKGYACVIIGTRMALFHTIPNLHTIIVDQSERMEHKQYDMHPRYHVSTIVCSLAKKIPLEIIIQSHTPRIEDMHASEQGILEHISTDTPNPITPVIHLTQEEYIPNAPLIGETLKGKITEQLSKNTNIFLFLNKKGLSSHVMCETCNTLFSCPTCNRHRAYSSKTHQLSCTFCNTNNPLPSSCPACRGNSFIFPGMGGEKIVSSLKKMFPDTPVHEINKDTTQTVSSQTRSGIQHQDTKPCIIVGTSFVPLSHPELFSSFGLVCILLADPSSSLSDFRSHEIQWQTLSRILMLAHAEKSQILIQAFQKNDPFISTLCKLDWKSFYTDQLQQRKTFGWPPYSRLIALHYHPQKTRQDEDALKNLTTTLTQTLKKHARVSPLQKRTAHEHDRLLITLDSPYIPYEPLPEHISQELKKLPTGWLVDIDANM